MTLALSLNPGDEFFPPVAVKRPVPDLSQEEFAQALADLHNIGLIRIVQGDSDWAMVQKRRPRS